MPADFFDLFPDGSGASPKSDAVQFGQIGRAYAHSRGKRSFLSARFTASPEREETRLQETTLAFGGFQGKETYVVSLPVYTIS